MTAPLVAFVHVPRSGGTTLTEVMRSVYGPRLLLANPHIGDPSVWPEELIEHVSEKRNFYSAFSGHFAYGIHSLFSRPTKYISCVRDPVERFESYFSYVRKQKVHHHHEAAINKSIGEFFRYLRSEGDIELFNLQCRLLCGQTDFRRAREWIEAHYLAVAPLPMIAPTIEYIARYLGWGAVTVPSLNSAERREFATDMVESDLRALKQGNSADHDIVSFCADFIGKQLARQDRLLQESPPSARSSSVARTSQAVASSELRDRLSRLHERILFLTSDRLDQVRQLSELQQRMEELNIDREARLRVILEQQQQMASLGEQVMAQQACINHVNADREARLNVILDQQAQMDLLRRQIADANSDLEARRQTALEKQAQLDALRAQIDEVKEHLSAQADGSVALNADQIERETLILEQRDMARDLELSHRLNMERMQVELRERERQLDECGANLRQLTLELKTFSRSRWVRLGSALRLTKLRSLATQR